MCLLSCSLVEVAAARFKEGLEAQLDLAAAWNNSSVDLMIAARVSLSFSPPSLFFFFPLSLLSVCLSVSVSLSLSDTLCQVDCSFSFSGSLSLCGAESISRGSDES